MCFLTRMKSPPASIPLLSPCHTYFAVMGASSLPKKTDQVGYDPKRSKVSDDKLAEFIRSAISGDITEVRERLRSRLWPEQQQ